MSAIKLSDDVYWVGAKDPELRIFDIVMETKYGTTYNAYLVKGEKTALIDTVKKEFTEEFLANVNEIVPIERIDYLVVNHNEPDHSGAITAILDKAPNIKLICSAPAVPFLKNVINREADITGVKDNHTLELGGKTLVFKGMPYMHWPDTMMEYLQEDRILFSNDGFTAHYSGDTIFADEVKIDLDHEVYYYWDCIMRPFSGYIRRNLPKLDDFDIGMVAGSHGPVYRKEPSKYIDKYKEWNADKAEGKKHVAVFFASNYGNTGKLAQGVAEGLNKYGFTTSINDVTELKTADAKELIESSTAVVLGTPTFNGDAVKPVWDLVNLFSTVYSIGKKAAVFGSYGWGGEGVKLVAQRLTGLKMKVYEENYRARLVPSDEEMSALDEYVGKIAEYFAHKK
jgi:flavorubredoxin